MSYSGYNVIMFRTDANWRRKHGYSKIRGLRESVSENRSAFSKYTATPVRIIEDCEVEIIEK